MFSSLGKLSLKISSKSAPDTTPPSKFLHRRAREASALAASYRDLHPHCPHPGNRSLDLQSSLRDSTIQTYFFQV